MVALYTHPDMLGHSPGAGHPESPARLKAVLDALADAGLATLTHTPAPMSFLNEICGRPDSEKPFLLLVAGHPAEGATVPLAALDKKPLEEIAAWI